MVKDDRRPRRAYQEPVHYDHPILYIVKGTALSVVVSLVFSVFLAVISLVTDLASVERYMSYIILGAALCSVFIGSAYAAQQAKSQGILIGAGVGIAYVLAVALFNMHLSADTFNLLMFSKKMEITTVTGAIGGMVGVNL